MFYTQDKETGTRIDAFTTREDAEQAVQQYEESDKAEGIYTEDFYEVASDEDEEQIPDVYDNLRKVCRAKGITLQAVAGNMGIAYQQMFKTLNSNPTIRSLHRVAQAAGCKVSDLIDPPSIVCPHCGRPINIAALE